MDLLLRVRVPGETQSHQDLRVSLHQSHLTSDVAAAVACHLGLADVAGFTIYRHGDQIELDPDTRFLDSKAVSGDSIDLVQTHALRSRSTTRELRVAVSGADGGATVTSVTRGRHTIGRSSSNTVVIPDQRIGEQQLTLDVDDGAVFRVAQAAGSRNPAKLNGHEIGAEPVRVDPGARITIGPISLEVAILDPPPAEQLDLLGQVPFNRSPRRGSDINEVVIQTITDLPTTPEPQKFRIVSIALPVIAAVVMAAILMEWRFLLFGLLSPVLAITGRLEYKRDAIDKYDLSVRQFESDYLALRAKADEASALEIEARELLAPDLLLLLRRAETRSRQLWNRKPAHSDFLEVRLGRGSLAAAFQIDPATGKGDRLFRDRLTRLRIDYTSVPNVPVAVSLARLGCLALCGEENIAHEMGRAVMLQVAALSSPEDVVLAAVTSAGSKLVDCLKWAPHSRSSASPLDGRHLATDEKQSAELLHKIGELVRFRLGAATQHGGEPSIFPAVVLLVDGWAAPDPTLTSQILTNGPRAGVYTVFLSPAPSAVPHHAAAVARLESVASARQSRVWFTDAATPPVWFDREGASVAFADRMLRCIAPLRDSTSGTSTSAIPRSVDLRDAVGLSEWSPTAIEESWHRDRGDALHSQFGRTATGAMAVDLVSQGPHTLIGGTSGAGKSELVQSLVAGLVVAQSPRRLNLLFIDFKGGSASEVFKTLPHVVGRVTDLDEYLSLRALTSIRAELRSRIANFAKCGANDLPDIRRRFPALAPASLVVVIDEFATLVKELPDFVSGMIDIAQRGRSYGIHLVLATQRPSTSVDENILANTNLRISLRMLDSAESMSLIQAPDAAYIPVPLRGRALARVGPNELVEFQSGFASAPFEENATLSPVLVVTFDGGPAELWHTSGSMTASDSMTRTQLMELVQTIELTDQSKARPVWNELLSPCIPLDDVIVERDLLAQSESDEGSESPSLRFTGRPKAGWAPNSHAVTVGRFDDPTLQAQYPAIADLHASASMGVFGSPRSGKSEALRTLALSSYRDSLKPGASPVVLAVFDFASGALADLGELPNCAGYALARDLETATRLLEHLDSEIDRRSDVPGPETLVLIDGWAAMAEALARPSSAQESYTDQWSEIMKRMVHEGRSVGVNVVFTADRLSSVPSWLAAATSCRLVLRQADDAEARELGALPTRSFPPGGGYLDGLRVQVAQAPLADRGPTPGSSRFATSALLVKHSRLKDARAEGPVELGVADISQTRIDVDLALGHFAIIGPPGSGRSTVLRELAKGFGARDYEIYGLGPSDAGIRSSSFRLAGWSPSKWNTIATALEAKLTTRGNEDDRNSATPSERPVLLFIDDLDRMDDQIVSDLFDDIADERALRIFATSARPFMTGMFSRLSKELGRCRQFLVLQPSSGREVAEAVGASRINPLRHGLSMPPGRGVLVSRGVGQVVHITTSEAELAG